VSCVLAVVVNNARAGLVLIFSDIIFSDITLRE